MRIFSALRVSSSYRIYVSWVRHHTRTASPPSRAYPDGLHAEPAFIDLDPISGLRTASLQRNSHARWHTAKECITCFLHLRAVLHRSFVLALSQHSPLSV